MRNSGSRNKIIKLILFLLAAILMVILSIAIGSVNISLPAMIKVIAGADTSSNEAKIILFVRLPRILSAILAGSALAVSGAVLQTILGNPVVSPGIIGINAGSGLFYLLASLFMPAIFFIKPVKKALSDNKALSQLKASIMKWNLLEEDDFLFIFFL